MPGERNGVDGVGCRRTPRWLTFGDFDQGDQWVKRRVFITKGSERQWLCSDFCPTGNLLRCSAMTYTRAYKPVLQKWMKSSFLCPRTGFWLCMKSRMGL